jgi:acyl-CoA thioester hydrolase
MVLFSEKKMNNKIFQLRFEVNTGHIDRQGHVNNVTYLQWVQDISEAHWLHLATAEALQKYFWVALRHEIDYKQQAFKGDTILLETSITSMQGYRSVREVWAYRGEKEKLLMHSVSTWCLMGANTLKPTRVSEDLLALLP